jgi:carbamoyl-phosphate synthase large subunit
MGTAESFGRAYDKAQDATDKPVPESGTAVVDLDSAGFPDAGTDEGEDLRAAFETHFDLREFETEEAFAEAIRAGEIDLIVSRERSPLEVAVEEGITYFSTLPSANAALDAIEAKGESLSVAPIGDRPLRQELWGQPKGE